VQHGAQKILLAVGGSATVDGGIGAVTALGWQFLDHKNNPVPIGGGGLEKIARIIKPEPSLLLNREGRAVKVEVLCDVDNPLTGENGAAEVYAPQKGATPKMVKRLDKGLAAWPGY
jgi:glycerate kinase